ncbi:snare associated Golgi protein-domain-containing protein [Pilobolus umbonatus]|nr:snare associated Golgi protein-domain-containing protein [Pilobolus umbonatus]
MPFHSPIRVEEDISEWQPHLPNSSYRIRIRRLRSIIHKWKWVIIPIGVFSVLGVLMWIFRREFFETLETLSHKLTSLGIGGYLLMSTLIIASAFPPILGYSTYITLSGYTFGFANGFILSYLSALIGSVACFSLSRMFMKNRVKRLLDYYSNMKIAVEAVEQKGFKLFLLIRLSPYPFNVLNVLFSATDISLLEFTLGTAITLTKIALHVYIGANLTSFAKHILGEDSDMTESDLRAERIRYISMVVGSALAVCVMVYIYSLVKQAVKEAVVQTEESVSFINNRYDEERDVSDMISMEDWNEWDNEEDNPSAVSDQLANKR